MVELVCLYIVHNCVAIELVVDDINFCVMRKVLLLWKVLIVVLLLQVKWYTR